MRIFYVVLILFAIVSAGLCSTRVEGEKYSLLTLREARDLHAKGGAHFIDVNEPEIYQRYHIPGATPVTSEDLKQFLPAQKQSMLVFYCAERRCFGSHAAAKEAVKLGYTNVFVMPEGIFGWVNAGLPVEKGTPQKPPVPGK